MVDIDTVQGYTKVSTQLLYNQEETLVRYHFLFVIFSIRNTLKDSFDYHIKCLSYHLMIILLYIFRVT